MMMNRISKHRNQKGATLLEALAFLGIAAIVIVGAISMFRSAQGSAQSNAMFQQLQSFRSAMKTLYGGQTNYSNTGAAGTGGLNQILINAKAVPDTLRVAGAVINNAFSGVVTVDGQNIDYTVRFTAVPQEVCVKVAPQTGSSWEGLTINGNAEISTAAGPVPVATASAQCVAGNNNILTWRGR